MKVCGKRDVLVPECSDCSELEERVEAVEECCDDAHDEIDTLNTDKADKDYVDDSIENVNQTIVDVADTLGERIDNIITASEPSVTTLWEGVMESIGDSANLSEDVNDFDYLDIYYRTSADESEGYYNTVRIPADQFANYTITVGGTLSPLGESPNLSQYLTQLSFVDDTATIDNIREWSWNGSQSSDASDDPQAETGVTIYRIDGVKETGGNAEIADAREGVDGTVYPSLGDAIREQIQDTRDMIQPCPVQDVQVNGTSVVDAEGIARITMPELIKTVNGNPIVIDDAFGEVKKLDVELLPIQDLHGYSKPWSAGAGKNILPPNATDETQTVNGVTCTATNGVYKIQGTPTAAVHLNYQLAKSVDLSPSTNKIFFNNSTANGNVYLYFRRGTDTVHYWGMSTANREASGWSDTGNEVVDNIDIYIYASAGAIDMTISPMLTKLAETDGSFAPYENKCPITGHDSVTVTDTDGDSQSQSKTVTLPHTVYGAGVGVTSGEGKEKVYFGQINPARIALQEDSTGCFWYSTLANQNMPTIASLNAGLLCERLEAENNTTLGSADGVITVYANGIIRWKEQSGMTLADYKTYLTNNPLRLCYELATPTDLQTTPTDITLYNGDNVISSDGEQTLTYVQDMAIVIRKIEAQI